MMTLVVMPNVELLVVDWLNGIIDELTDLAVDIHSAFGPNQTWPALRVLRLGGSRPYPVWVDRARIQVEGWGNTKTEALDVTEVALGALQLAPGTHDEGVVSADDVGLAPTWSPDEPTGQPRYVADVLITVHPHRQGGS